MLTGSCHCGAVTWSFEGRPEEATACNCSACRRYGVLWAYGHEGVTVTTTGSTTAYGRDGAAQPPGGLRFHFCPHCGGLAYWRGQVPLEDGRRRIAINLRLCDDLASVADIPLRHLDGAESWDRVEGRPAQCVGDLWF